LRAVAEAWRPLPERAKLLKNSQNAQNPARPKKSDVTTKKKKKRCKKSAQNWSRAYIKNKPASRNRRAIKENNMVRGRAVADRPKLKFVWSMTKKARNVQKSSAAVPRMYGGAKEKKKKKKKTAVQKKEPAARSYRA